MSGPARGRRSRASMFRALLPCLALVAWDTARAQAQTADPRPVPAGTRWLRLAAGFAAAQDHRSKRVTIHGDPSDDSKLRDAEYARAVADRADPDLWSARRQRRVRLRLRLAQSHPQEAEALSGPGQAEAAARSRQSRAAPPPVDAAGSLRLSIPPSEIANKTPLPPAMAGTVEGQPPRKRLKVDDDPFGAVGDYAGSFLIKSAVELSGGYDTNPGRLNVPKGMPFWVVAPEFLAVSDWDRHALVADLRGSFTGYGNSLPPTIDGAVSPAPTNVDRPELHRSHRRPSRCHRGHPPHLGSAAAGVHRQSRQPEHPGRPRQISDLYDARRHASASTRISTGWISPSAAPSIAPSTRTPRSPTAPPPPMTTATSTSMAASAASATS